MDSLKTDQQTDTPYSPVHQHNFQKATLLVVEDQEDIWTLVHFSLKKFFPDVTLHRCANRKQVIGYLTNCLTNQTALPKLILQDLYLPQSAVGFGLLNDVRMLLGNQQQIPILVMSSSVAEADIRQAYQQGASFYIVKPQTMNRWLSLAQSLRQFWWEQGVLPLDSTGGSE
ncbi:response regulator [Spirosoma endophyticum]|uniref:CheY chemotaxis protein or a CheY-like REC (Receiver) domain n=1 Tax=Spirosoma endophyticum TaxID=662367 RepID=A0A1I1SK23_9BACT|nr:response regulator [Spirosoma endophyticum]SFD44223.1 CheY chemotaxis protein or a CheY-like REC (receiver) domain [Spirosoma endophyticum]